MAKGDRASTYVSLDLETTGLNSDRDTIIEIGAVKFQGQRVIETFQSLVNPYRDLPEFIQRLTGISQKVVDRASPFAAVSAELEEFIGSSPIVGHNITFDLGFLSKHGLQLSNEAYDTWDLASIILPYSTDYSLGRLASDMDADHDRPHRALSDARATQMVFNGLLQQARGLDPSIGAFVHQMASRARWPVGRLLGSIVSSDRTNGSQTGVLGIDTETIAKRLERSSRALRPVKDINPLDEAELAAYLGPDGLFSRNFPGFEHRVQQVGMMAAVAGAINQGEHLIVEGGTGVGKSLAYLLPAILYALRNGTRVVVSTNTINLQEQLLQKDIPTLVGVLEEQNIIPANTFKAVSLKGRSNYLCLRRWNRLAGSEGPTGDDVRLLAKTLVWLQDTSTGDRGEINLSGRDAITWGQLSADEKGQCPGMRGEGVCFLRAARDKAQEAHLIVVNHSLLLSDLALGGGLLPEYQHLIVDEAHHLEEVATRQLGFQISQHRLNDDLNTLERLTAEVRLLIRGSSASGTQAQLAEQLASDAEHHWSKKVRDDWRRFWDVLEQFLVAHQEGNSGQGQLSITRSIKVQPGWSDVEIAWEKVDAGLTDGIRQIERLGRFLDSLPIEGLTDPQDTILELATWTEGVQEVQERLKTLVAAPHNEQRIDWMSQTDGGRNDQTGRSSIVLHSAPLEVGQDLEEHLFSQKRSVVVTSATLSTEGDFHYIRDRIGLADSKELLVGSPFDYSRAALLLIPEDMPMPDAWEYQQSMERLLVALGSAINGRTLVLFTSHAALQGAARAIRGPLGAEGIRVLAQGIDGSPRQILRSFGEDSKGVILGASSFWEGVDVSGGQLKALVLARLPFHVPTEPIFAARSAEYEDAFHQYALPQAVLRFRQGIGRLIRSSQDKGTIVVLDKRIIARKYGKAFLDSIPPCTVKRGPLATIPQHATRWIETEP